MQAIILERALAATCLSARRRPIWVNNGPNGECANLSAWCHWRTSGIPGIDYEHRRLVDMLNEIHELISNGAAARLVADTLARFHTLATAHFALEEKIMRDQSYPGFESRRDIHYRMLDQVREMMDDYEDETSLLRSNLPETLKQWLAEAMEVDVKLFAEINESGLAQRDLSRR